MQSKPEARHLLPCQHRESGALGIGGMKSLYYSAELCKSLWFCKNVHGLWKFQASQCTLSCQCFHSPVIYWHAREYTYKCRHTTSSGGFLLENLPCPVWYCATSGSGCVLILVRTRGRVGGVVVWVKCTGLFLRTSCLSQWAFTVKWCSNVLGERASVPKEINQPETE